MRKIPRHGFKYLVETIDGGAETQTLYVKTKYATKPVRFPLIAADVRRALEMDGVGNPSKCAGAVCTRRNKNAFPHPVAGGVDWLDRRAYVISKLDKNNTPSECVAYSHQDDLAALFDGGPEEQKKLLRELETYGSRTIKLYPVRRRASAAGRKDPPRPEKQKVNPDGTRKTDGTRSPKRGVALRFFRKRLGMG